MGGEFGEATPAFVSTAGERHDLPMSENFGSRETKTLPHLFKVGSHFTLSLLDGGGVCRSQGDSYSFCFRRNRNGDSFVPYRNVKLEARSLDLNVSRNTLDELMD